MTDEDNPDGLPFRIAYRHPDETWTYTEGEPIPMVDACPKCATYQHDISYHDDEPTPENTASPGEGRGPGR